MASSGKDAGRQLEAAINAIYRKVDTAVRQMVIQADTNLVIRTPVDTGRARSNWRVSLGAPSNYSSINPVSAQQTIADGERVVGSIPPLRFGISSDQPPIFITNNVNYIGDLNRGKSRQAPAGYVEQAVSEAVRFAFQRLK